MKPSIKFEKKEKKYKKWAYLIKTNFSQLKPIYTNYYQFIPLAGLY